MAAAILVVPRSEAAAAPGAVDTDPNCATTSLLAGPNASESADLGFTMPFQGESYSSVFVHEDGFVTLGSAGPLFGLPDAPLVDRGIPIIAPLLVNGDRILPESEVTYGEATFDGRPAFCVNWSDLTQPPPTDAFGNPEPGPFPGDPTNRFQLIIVDRSDIAAGNVDLIFNYEYVNWAEELQYSGDPLLARAGWSNGNPLTPDTTFELPGSGPTGGLDDFSSGPGTTSTNAAIVGRHVFAFGEPAAPTTIDGTVTTSFDGTPVANAPVTVCTLAGQPCTVDYTDAAGEYSVGVADGAFSVTAFGAENTQLLPQTVEPVTVAGASETVDFALGTLRSGTGVVFNPSIRPGQIFWGATTQLRVPTCPGAVAYYTIEFEGVVIDEGFMVEDPAGSGVMTATIPPLAPSNGMAVVSILFECPDGTDGRVVVDLYIDPSGTVRDEVTGLPVAGATTTLYRSDEATGPFDVVPDGSAVMSPFNRTNPDVTTQDGLFGWDVIAGFYVVRAEAPSCVAPGDPTQAFTETDVLPVEPEWLGLELFLRCAPTVSVPADVAVSTADPAGAPVGYTAAASDDADGALAVDCDTPSGSTFPIGSTTVTCSTVDSGGFSATASFDVTVTLDDPGGPECTIEGDERSNILVGTSGDDVICGFGGNDVIIAGRGNDIVLAGGGNDLVFGNRGDDELHGDDGRDILIDLSGDNTLLGGAGRDLLLAGRGDDVLDGGLDQDRCSAGSGTNTVLDC